MARTIVGVLRGGTSSEYNLSLQTGAAMMEALPQERYTVRDIFIDHTGLWHLRGMPATPARALSQLDVVLNGLHGGVGEDGTVQRLLKRAGVPFAGSAGLPSGLALNKILAREILRRAGVRVPRGIAFDLGERLDTAAMARQTFAQFPPPYVVKPPSEGASYGIVVAATLRDLPKALGDTLDRFGSALVEEFIRGRSASVGLIEKFRNEELYALPPAFVMLPEDSIIIETSHHEQARLRHMVPSDFSDTEKRALMDTARAAHRALGLKHFSRADLIVTPRQVYLLEINTLPGLYAGASFPHMLDSIGSSVSEFLEHAIALARQ